MANVWEHISLDHERDADILEVLGKVRNKSDFVREAIRQSLAEPKCSDCLEAIRDLEAEVRHLRLSGVKVGSEPESLEELEEPEEAAKNLDGLLDRLKAGSLSNFANNS